MIARLYCDTALVAGAELDLPQPVAHHAVRVLRLKSGDAVTLFNGQGGEVAARLAGRPHDNDRTGAREVGRAIRRDRRFT
jgi:16S rRNA U1498 N3-methylase RsmE